MDDEDDARYPPNPHRSDPRRQFPSSHRSQSIARNYPADDDEDEEEEQNDNDQAEEDQEHDDEEEDDEDGYAGGYRRVGEDVVGGGDDDEDDSSESRGKRRKIDSYALGFEFAPRAAPAVKPAPLPPPPAGRSPADWSEESTFVLLDSWGDFYLQNGRKSIRSDEWSEVAKKVCQVSKAARTDSQCRNRLDTLKKKYRKEITKVAEGTGFKSEWIYFSKMDALMSSPSPPQQPASRQQQQQLQQQQLRTRRLPCGVDAGEYVFTGPRVRVNRANGVDEMRDSPGDTGSEDDDDEDDESDGLPPRREKHRSDSSFRLLADSIQKFGEIYEKIENSKRQQMVELERMRNEFHRDLEVQKRQILERAQAEIANIRQEEGGEEKTEDEDSGDGDDNDVST